MKRFYITAILALICTIASYAQTIFDRYADTEGVTTVYISKAMLSMMPDMKTNGVNIGPIASKLDNIRILTCENNKLLPTLRKRDPIARQGLRTAHESDRQRRKCRHIHEYCSTEERLNMW